MKIFQWCFFIINLFLLNDCFAQNATTITAEFFSPLSCALVVLPSQVDCSPDFINTLVKDFQFTKQFVVTVRRDDNRLPSLIMKDFEHEKIPFVLFLKQDNSFIDWWLYDGLSGSKIAAKRYVKMGTVIRGWAHQIADMVWEVLTGRPGFFGTKITYCKESCVKRGISLKALCIADYDGTHEQVVIDEKTVLLAPRWHENASKPIIFYSEEAIKNTRLLSVDLHKRSFLVSNNLGINMLLAFNKSGTRAVYSASDTFGYSQIVSVQSKGFVFLTSYKANSLGPVFDEHNKKIYFYSDAFDKLPQICFYDYQKKEVVQITKSGYNVAPAYCAYTNQLAYTSMKNKYMQIILFDPRTGLFNQLTKDQSNKEDCSWSPGGDFLLVCVTTEKTQRLALYNVIMGTYTYITDSKSRCSDPHWSPCYKEFPILFD